MGKCTGYGWIRHEHPQGRYFNGWEHFDYVACECQSEEIKRRSWKLSRKASNLSPVLEEKTFDSFDEQRQPEAYRAALNFAQDPNGWMMFYGIMGGGKTHLMAAIANQMLGRGQRALYVITPELLKFLREGFDKEAKELHEDAAKRLDQIRTADVLLLDDLGSEKASEWAVEQIYLILDYRYRNRLPTAISSNLTPDAFPSSMMRIADRLQDVRLCRIISLRGESYRRKPGA